MLFSTSTMRFGHAVCKVCNATGGGTTQASAHNVLGVFGVGYEPIICSDGGGPQAVLLVRLLLVLRSALARLLHVQHHRLMLSLLVLLLLMPNARNTHHSRRLVELSRTASESVLQWTLLHAANGHTLQAGP
jgi:hypothetical protein